jgi:hypothetical protein
MAAEYKIYGFRHGRLIPLKEAALTDRRTLVDDNDNEFAGIICTNPQEGVFIKGFFYQGIVFEYKDINPDKHQA